jgi:hypothetical protein
MKPRDTLGNYPKEVKMLSVISIEYYSILKKFTISKCLITVGNTSVIPHWPGGRTEPWARN